MDADIAERCNTKLFWSGLTDGGYGVCCSARAESNGGSRGYTDCMQPLSDRDQYEPSLRPLSEYGVPICAKPPMLYCNSK